MVEGLPTIQKPRKPSWHLWVVGVVSMIWNMFGLFLALAAQSGALPHLRSEERAYFAAQEWWLVLIADLGLVAAVAGALALLLLHRAAVWLYAATFAIILSANLYDLAGGTSPMLRDPGSVGTTVFVLILMALQIAYAAAMRRKGFLE